MARQAPWAAAPALREGRRQGPGRTRYPARLGADRQHDSGTRRSSSGTWSLVASSGRTVTEVARELGVSRESLRGWVKKASGVATSRRSRCGTGLIREA
ncbi:transposase [Streptomyces sp. NPDC049627]|uniref:transposase n=1 Tax=Streptomyces sp. NPDC049627 TaxID=3365595 RepID=UPI0037A70CA7